MRLLLTADVSRNLVPLAFCPLSGVPGMPQNSPILFTWPLGFATLILASLMLTGRPMAP